MEDLISPKIKAQILGLACYGDPEMFDGESVKCNGCLLRQDCLLASFNAFLKITDMLMQAKRSRGDQLAPTPRSR